MVDTSTPAEARRDAAAAAKLAKTDPSELSDDQVEQLDLLLEMHQNNPYFAEQFATGMGPTATLKFYAELADPRQFKVDPRSSAGLSDGLKARQKLIGDLEKSLGTTLSTATRVDDPAMRKWKTDMIALGDDRRGSRPDRRTDRAEHVRQGTASKVYYAGQEASWIPAGRIVNPQILKGWNEHQLESLNERLTQAKDVGYNTGSQEQGEAGNGPV
jgi:hypothetical protein